MAFFVWGFSRTIRFMSRRKILVIKISNRQYKKEAPVR
jgi:hypothetical protein